MKTYLLHVQRETWHGFFKDRKRNSDNFNVDFDESIFDRGPVW